MEKDLGMFRGDILGSVLHPKAKLRLVTETPRKVWGEARSSDSSKVKGKSA
jgi:hypothetical protein